MRVGRAVGDVIVAFAAATLFVLVALYAGVPLPVDGVVWIVVILLAVAARRVFATDWRTGQRSDRLTDQHEDTWEHVHDLSRRGGPPS